MRVTLLSAPFYLRFVSQAPRLPPILGIRLSLFGRTPSEFDSLKELIL
jgi:hypothetical protein